ncbi:MAG: dihydroorotase [Candidatus Micrarchaeia archaeon]
MIISGAMIATMKGLVRADIEVSESGIISRVGTGFSGGRASKSRLGPDFVDASGMVVFPGGIDPHVHLRDPQSPAKEDFFTGTSAALAGGYTTVFDMPNYSNPPTTTAKAYGQKKEIAGKKAVCNWRLHFGATQDNHAEVAKAKPMSMKAYLGETDSPLTFETLEGLLLHFEKFPTENPICIHAEDLDAIRYFSKRFGKGARYSASRPAVVAQAAAARVSILASYFDRRIHLCHATTGEEIVQVKNNNRNSTVEATPHHMFLDSSFEERLGEFHHVKPPLRSKAEVAGLWQNIHLVDCIGSDHAPHTADDKKNGASGYPQLDTTMPLMLWALEKQLVEVDDIVRLCCEGPAKIFGVQGRGAIKEGYHADLAIYDLSKKWKVKNSDLFTKCGWSPYEGMELGPRPSKVFVNGSLAFDSGSVVAKPGSGIEAD